MEARYGGIELTGSIVYEELATMGVTDSPSVAITAAPRADEPYIRSLGNRATGVRFSFWRFYPSLLEAMAARGGFIKSLPKSGQLQAVQYSMGGSLLHVADAWLLPTPEPIFQTRGVFFQLEFAVKNLTTTLVLGDFLLDSEGEVVLDHNNEPVYN